MVHDNMGSTTAGMTQAGFLTVFLSVLFFVSPGGAFQSFEEFNHSRAKTPNVEVTAVSSSEAVNPGDRFQLFVLVHLAEGWHIYSLEEQGNDETLPTRIFADQNVFDPQGPWQEPPPKIIMDGALERVMKTHEKLTEFRRLHQVPSNLDPGIYSIAGRVEFRACDNRTCTLPRQLTFHTRIRVLPGNRDHSLNKELLATPKAK